MALGLSTPDPSLSPTHLSIRRGRATTTHYTHHQVSLMVSRNTTLVPSLGLRIEAGLSVGMRRERVPPQRIKIKIKKVVYQRVRREIWLASDNSWTRHRLKHLCWRSRWIILCTLERRITVSCEISRANRCLLACPPDWAQCPPLLRDERGLPLPGCRTIVPVLWIYLSRLYMLPTFQPLSENSLSVLRAPYCFDR